MIKIDAFEHKKFTSNSSLLLIAFPSNKAILLSHLFNCSSNFSKPEFGDKTDFKYEFMDKSSSPSNFHKSPRLIAFNMSGILLSKYFYKQ